MDDKAERPEPMTKAKRSVSKPGEAIALLQQASNVLKSIGGKDKDIWQAIAVKVDDCYRLAEKHK